MTVDQTIFASDPNRPGNCVSACAATHLGLPLDAVPHFIEQVPGSTVDGSEGADGWWWLLIGFMAGAAGLWPTELDSIDDGHPDEVLWVAGPSPRGVLHQVLYRNGALWHDPHPSRDGVLEVREVIAWRPATHDHTPTEETR